MLNIQKEFAILQNELIEKYGTNFSINLTRNRISIIGTLEDLNDKIKAIAKDVMAFAEVKLDIKNNHLIPIPMISYFLRAERYNPLCVYTVQLTKLLPNDIR